MGEFVKKLSVRVVSCRSSSYRAEMDLGRNLSSSSSRDKNGVLGS